MKPAGAKRLHVEPITMAQANRYVDIVHRHHGRVQPGISMVAIAAVDESGLVCGVAIGGFPVAANRLADGFRTFEVTRVATDGTPNACSLLYAAMARAAKALGYSRCITYILDHERGGSIRAAGWSQDVGDFGGLSWADHSTKPSVGSNVGPKGRWSLTLAGVDRPVLRLPPHAEEQDAQLAFDEPNTEAAA